MDFPGLLAQLLNGVQYGLLLFLIASGLTLIFGVMGIINLAHGSLFMIGAYVAFLVARQWGSVWLALPVAVVGGIAAGPAAGARPVPLLLHARPSRPGAADLRADPAVRGRRARCWSATTSIRCRCRRCSTSRCRSPPGFSYSAYRFAVIGICLALAALLFWWIERTKMGAIIRAAAEKPEMVDVLGIDARGVHMAVFAHRHDAGAGGRRAGGAALFRLSQHGRRLPDHLVRGGGDRRARLGVGRLLVGADHRPRRHARQGLRAEGGRASPSTC